MSKSPLTSFYDDYWAQHAGWSPHPSLTSLKRKLLIRFVTSQTLVLDVGCGDGSHYGGALAAVAQEYHGLEVSVQAVQAAQSKGIRAQCHDLQAPFPYPNETFDIVLCIEVFEHLFDPAYSLGEIRRVIRRDGHLILAVPNIAHFSNRIRAILGGFAPGGTPDTSSRRPWADPHIRFFTTRSLHALLTEQRFRPRELYGEGCSLFSTIPGVSRIAARFAGWERLERWSQPFEFLARLWPSLFAGHLIMIGQPIS